MMLDHIHCRAICDEIGERLREVLRREASEMPPRLLMLVDELAQLDDHGPSIAPSIDEMSFPLCPKFFDSAKRSADEASPATNRGLVFAGP
jgi:hypothetical protein